MKRSTLVPPGMGPTEGRKAAVRQSTMPIFSFLLVLLVSLARPTVSSALDLSNVPMESKVATAPANIMFVIDNSSSMDWEFATNESEGMFFGSYLYLYINSEDYETGWYGLQFDDVRRWKARYCGYNHIYYNPRQRYLPWPEMAAIRLAELTSVHSEPQLPAPTFDLTSSYYTIDGLNISYLSYHSWHDANGDQVIDNGEIYLVNLTVNDGIVDRSYYRLNDIDGNDQVDAGELTRVTGADIPESVKAIQTGEDGSTSEMTAEQDALNFANWFAYFRKRSMTAKYAISEAIGGFSNVNVGYYTINDAGGNSRIGVRPVKLMDKDGVSQDTTSDLRQTLYNFSVSSSTPLRTAFYDVGRYFKAEDSGGFSPDPSHPFVSEADGGACQQSFAILITDGYYNDDVSPVGNFDGNIDGDPSKPARSAPYADQYPDTLADIAMKFYDEDLALFLPDEGPTSIFDQNKKQHLITYAVSFGVEGSIPLNDMDRNGEVDATNCSYADDPYFLNTCTPRPVWPDPSLYASPHKIDDLWHASINGRGQFFSAANPAELVDALKKITNNISNRTAFGGSVAVNSGQLTDDSVMYESTYNPAGWTGNIFAYPLVKTGKLLKRGETELWQAAAKLDAKSWDSRLIFTGNGENSGIAFTFASLTPVQQVILGSEGLVNYLRGEQNASLRERQTKLGDIVNASPLLLGKSTPANGDGLDNDGDGQVDEAGERAGGTVFVGANDGMLHAFNAQTGEERFAFIPSLVHDHLADLSSADYTHRFFVDATPVSKILTFAKGNRRTDSLDNDGDGQIDESDENYGDGIDNNGDGTVDEAAEKGELSLLVGGLGRGGKGFFALDVSLADQITAATPMASLATMLKWEYPRRYFDGLDNDGDSFIDEADEATGREYLYDFAGDQTSLGGANYADGRDNNGDGQLDEAGEKAIFIKAAADGVDNDSDGTVDEEDEVSLAYRDDDLGYSYASPAIVRSYRTRNLDSAADHPWIVVFGNGYDSQNGRAVLYVLDALTGELLRKIDTGVGNKDNGLSSPIVVDVNNDDRADFAYAGDLRGNLWKFDLTSSDPTNWRVAHEDSDGKVQPLFSAPGQAITTKPDVMAHCTKHGYLVTFGTGKFLGDLDRTDSTQQSIFGIWDYGDEAENEWVSAHNGQDDDQDGIVDEADETRPVDRHEYPGAWDRTTNHLTNIADVSLQQQVLINEQYNAEGVYLRTISNHVPQWYLAADGTVGQKDDPASIQAYLTDGKDNDNDGEIDETAACDRPPSGSSTTCLHIDSSVTEASGHVGWYFDLPGVGSMDQRDNDGNGTIDEMNERTSLAAERIIEDVKISDGRLTFITFIPDSAPCSGGGISVDSETTACSGGRLPEPVIDLNSDGEIDGEDSILVNGERLVHSGRGVNRQLTRSVNIQDGESEYRISTGGDPDGTFTKGKAPKAGPFFWQEVTNSN